MHSIAFSIATLLGIAVALPAFAANENVITQSKALAGNVTPGDTPGYPITINTPGAYVLGSGLDVPAGQWGIVVNAHNVDIDMSGYTLSGNGVADYGVVSGYQQSRIHDGVIKSFKASGMYLRGDAWTIEDMKIVQNGGMGIDASETTLIKVLNTLVAVNGGLGIRTGNIGLFRNNEVVNNAQTGISCRESCHAEGNIVDLNKEWGIYFHSGLVVENTISRNTVYGLSDGNGGGDVGYSNNMFVNNYPSATKQIDGAVPVHPNTCVGNPCGTP